MKLKAVEVKALENYKLHVKFNDGVEGDIDLSGCLDGEVFQCWKIPGVFEKVYINESGIAWNDNLDIDILNVYLTLTNQTYEEYLNKRQLHA